MDSGWLTVGQTKLKAGYTAEPTDATVTLDDSNVCSVNAILNDNTFVAQKEAQAIICPASMTKILTVLVVAEHITDLPLPLPGGSPTTPIKTNASPTVFWMKKLSPYGL